MVYCMSEMKPSTAVWTAEQLLLAVDSVATCGDGVSQVEEHAHLDE